MPDKNKTGRYVLDWNRATGVAVNLFAGQWLAHPLLPPAHGRSVALQ
jgi:hypothetical protein